MVQNRMPIPNHSGVDEQLIASRVDIRNFLDLPTEIWKSYRAKWFAMFDFLYRYDFTELPGFTPFGECLDPNSTVMTAAIGTDRGKVVLNRHESEDVMRKKISEFMVRLLRSTGWAPSHKEDIDRFEQEIS